MLFCFNNFVDIVIMAVSVKNFLIYVKVLQLVFHSFHFVFEFVKFKLVERLPVSKIELSKKVSSGYKGSQFRGNKEVAFFV